MAAMWELLPTSGVYITLRIFRDRILLPRSTTYLEMSPEQSGVPSVDRKSLYTPSMIYFTTSFLVYYMISKTPSQTPMAVTGGAQVLLVKEFILFHMLIIWVLFIIICMDVALIPRTQFYILDLLVT